MTQRRHFVLFLFLGFHEVVHQGWDSNRADPAVTPRDEDPSPPKGLDWPERGVRERLPKGGTTEEAEGLR